MNRYDPKGPAFLRLGRFDAKEAGCRLWWSGSGIATRLDCTRLEIEADVPDGEFTPWLAVTVDGAPVARFALRPGLHRYDLLGRMERGFAHEIAVVRDSQPTDNDAGPLTLTNVYTDGKPELPEPKKRLIEFLGDSLTVGEGTVGPTHAQEWRMVWISNQFAFPTLAARRLDAEKRVVALGGWGAHRSFDGDATHTIGGIYDALCAVVRGGESAYDFALQRPADAVVINLGTNDASALNKMDDEERRAELAAFEESAVALLEKVRLRNPGAAILWAYGLCGDAMAEPIRRAVARRNAKGDERTRYLALDDCAGDLGSRSHPGRASHRRAAEQIAAALERML